MPSALQANGAAVAPSRHAAIHTNRFFTGLWTQRNPLRDAATPYLYEKFYGGSRFDSLLAGQNVELTTRMTLARRPGLTPYNSQVFPPIIRFYEFRKFGATGETIHVMADTAHTVYDATGPGTRAAIFSKSTTNPTYFQGVGNTLYAGDSAEQMAWDGINLARNWGIDIGSINTAILENCGTGTDVAVSGASPWSNPGNITAPDANYASVTIGVTGGVTSVVVTNGGSGYTSAPTVGFSGGGGSGAAATATVDTSAGGKVLRVSISNGGSNYFIGDQLIIDAGNFDCVLTVTRVSGGIDAGGGIRGVQISAPGTGYSVASNIPCDGGSGSGATVSVTQVSSPTGFVTSVTVTSPGSGYSSPPTVSFSGGGGSGAAANASIGSGTPTSDYLVAKNFGFALAATDTVLGIVASITGFQNLNVGSQSMTASLTFDGVTPSGTPFQFTLPGTNGTFTLGGSGSLWGLNSIGPSQIGSNANFGIIMQASDTDGSTTFNVDFVQLTVYKSGGPSITLVNSGSGDLAATNGGFQYAFAYGNSTTAPEVVSNISSPSIATGNNTGSTFNVQVVLVHSTDPQVTKIHVYRTKDGGSIFYELPNSPVANVDQTFTDNLSQTLIGSTRLDLVNTQNFFNQAPTFVNSRPPAGLINLTYHLGRVWGSGSPSTSNANIVYYSRNGDNSVTSVGNGNEAFPPQNTFTFPSQVVRLEANPLGLMVFTVSDVYVIQGDIVSTPLFATPFVRNPGGLLDYDALAVLGTTYYMLTTDLRVVSFDPGAGIVELGFPIGDQLPLFYSATNAYLTWHLGGSSDTALYVADGSSGWFRMTPLAAPEAGMSVGSSVTWSPRAVITGGTSAVQSVEISPGQHALLVGPQTTGPILRRDSSVNTDNGKAFTANATIGSLVLAQPGQMAELSFITTDSSALNGGTAPSIFVLGDEINPSLPFIQLSSFATDPPALLASTSVQANRYYFSQARMPAWCRHLLINMAWGSTNTPDELLSYTIYGGIWQEKNA